MRGAQVRIVLQEVVIFAVTGFIIGALLSAGVYGAVRAATSMPIVMTPARLAAVFFLTLMMCWVSGLLATRKLRTADPDALARLVEALAPAGKGEEDGAASDANEQAADDTAELVISSPAPVPAYQGSERTPQRALGWRRW